MREGTFTIRLDDEKVFFKVYKPLKTLSHYKDLCMSTMIKGNKCGVGEFSPPITYSDFLIAWSKPQMPQPKMIQIDEPEKAIIKKSIDLERSHS